jgi:hypothetical protein
MKVIGKGILISEDKSLRLLLLYQHIEDNIKDSIEKALLAIVESRLPLNRMLIKSLYKPPSRKAITMQWFMWR